MSRKMKAYISTECPSKFAGYTCTVINRPEGIELGIGKGDCLVKLDHEAQPQYYSVGNVWLLPIPEIKEMKSFLEIFQQAIIDSIAKKLSRPLTEEEQNKVFKQNSFMMLEAMELQIDFSTSPEEVEKIIADWK